MNTTGSFDVSMRVFERAADLFGLLSTPVRLRVVAELCCQERNVSELLECIDVTQPNMSQHLNLLYRAGVVSKRRDGAQIFYRVNHESQALVCDAVHSLITHRARDKVVFA